jgi:hypothetical protein
VNNCMLRDWISYLGNPVAVGDGHSIRGLFVEWNIVILMVIEDVLTVLKSWDGCRES